jgi:glyoxylase-like metal-dependent hydrolase (beta-lactamase superfamily II)
VRTGRYTILVDSCIGNDKDRPTRPKWHRRQGDFLTQLAAAGVTPDDVDFVMCTHLHADHVGWNTRLVNGAWVPTFPKAQYLIAEPEYAHWKRQHDSNPPEPVLHGSFADSVLPVVQAGQAVMVRMDHEVEAGLHLEPAVGHTPGNVVIHVQNEGRHAVLLGDVLHHPVQLAYPEWSTRFCEDPAQSAKTRRGLIECYADTQTRLVTAHFAAPTFGRAVRDGASFGFVFDD